MEQDKTFKIPFDCSEHDKKMESLVETIIQGDQLQRFYKSIAEENKDSKNFFIMEIEMENFKIMKITATFPNNPDRKPITSTPEQLAQIRQNLLARK